jgi:hypothetical protein
MTTTLPPVPTSAVPNRSIHHRTDITSEGSLT